MNDSLYSYHIFSFPFKWERTLPSSASYSHKIDLQKITPPAGSPWRNIGQPETTTYQVELYNEKNYFYDFVHPVLYDDGNRNQVLIKHYERDEVYQGKVFYKITLPDITYKLEVASISLNLYSSGVGILSIYLKNYEYGEFTDVLKINQYGRRIYPPFLTLTNGVASAQSTELAQVLALEGMFGDPGDFREDFSSYNEKQHWKPCKLIETLLRDFKDACNWKIEPVFDDRMFVTCWVGSNSLSQQITANPDAYLTSDDWYKLMFLDVQDPTCQHAGMRRAALEKHTLPRWQAYGTLCGVTRYSLVMLTNDSSFSKEFLLTHLRTMYYRMVELNLVQRASLLKFSDEVTVISNLKFSRASHIVDEVSNLYHEYIRFTNKIYFREVTAQEQGIEIYQKIQEVIELRDLMRDLDGEIEELQGYVSLVEEKERNRNLSILTIAASVFVIPTFIVGYLGMNVIDKNDNPFGHLRTLNITLITLVAIALLAWLRIETKQRWKQRIIIASILGLILLCTIAVLTIESS